MPKLKNLDLGKHKSLLERRKAFILKNQPEWKQAGKKFKAARLSAKLTLRNMSDYSGFSQSTFIRFEHGEPIFSRKPVKKAYFNAILSHLEFGAADLFGLLKLIED